VQGTIRQQDQWLALYAPRPPDMESLSACFRPVSPHLCRAVSLVALPLVSLRYSHQTIRPENRQLFHHRNPHDGQAWRLPLPLQPNLAFFRALNPPIDQRVTRVPRQHLNLPCNRRFVPVLLLLVNLLRPHRLCLVFRLRHNRAAYQPSHPQQLLRRFRLVVLLQSLRTHRPVFLQVIRQFIQQANQVWSPVGNRQYLRAAYRHDNLQRTRAVFQARNQLLILVLLRLDNQVRVQPVHLRLSLQHTLLLPQQLNQVRFRLPSPAGGHRQSQAENRHGFQVRNRARSPLDNP
jgi:hypothetical protein